MTAKTCNFSPAHQTQPLIGICLESQCQNDPLICKLCLTENHYRHIAILLDEQHAQIRSSIQIQESTEELDARLKAEEQNLQLEVLKACDSLRNLSTVIQSKLKKTYTKPKTVICPLTQGRVLEIISYLLTSNNITPTLTQAYLTMIRNYYQKWNCEELKPLRQEKQLSQYLSQLLSNTSLQIQNIITKLESDIRIYRESRAIDCDHPLVKLEDQPIFYQPHVKIEKSARKERVVEESMGEEKMVNEGVLKFEEKRKVRNILLSEEVLREDKEMMAEEEKENKQPQQIEQPEQFGQPGQIQNQPQYPQKANKLMSEQKNQYQQQQSQDLLKKYNLAKNNTDKKIDKVILRQTKWSRINEIIPKIDPTKMKELTLTNNASPDVINADSADLIGKMIHLKGLRLYWVRNLKDIAAARMLRYLAGLQELCLAQFGNCSHYFINALKANNRRLRKISFGMDILCLRFTEENIDFMPDMAYYYLADQQAESLANSLMELTTIELYRPQNKAFWQNYLSSQSKRLQEFTLSNIDQTQHSTASKTGNCDGILRSLRKCRGIHSLRLEQSRFDENVLVRVLQNNPKMRTFICNECKVITNKTLWNLSHYCKQLQELSIQMNDKIDTTDMVDMNNLKTLVIRGCWGIKEKDFCENIKKMSQLKCLIVDFNATWMGKAGLETIAVLPKLKVLNISGNNITTYAIKALSDNATLSTLVCHSNCFCWNELCHMNFAKTLKKLSIGKNTQQYPLPEILQRFDMKKLADNFPNLSHLKLNNFSNVKAEPLGSLGRMICLTMVGCPAMQTVEVGEFCDQNHIYFNQNEQQ